MSLTLGGNLNNNCVLSQREVSCLAGFSTATGQAMLPSVYLPLGWTLEIGLTPRGVCLSRTKGKPPLEDISVNKSDYSTFDQ